MRLLTKGVARSFARHLARHQPKIALDLRRVAVDTSTPSAAARAFRALPVRRAACATPRRGSRAAAGHSLLEKPMRPGIGSMARETARSVAARPPCPKTARGSCQSTCAGRVRRHRFDHGIAGRPPPFVAGPGGAIEALSARPRSVVGLPVVRPAPSLGDRPPSRGVFITRISRWSGRLQSINRRSRPASPAQTAFGCRHGPSPAGGAMDRRPW